MLAGRRIMFAYGVGGDFFANVKPELLPDDTWAAERQDLLDEIAAMVAAEHDTLPNKSLPETMRDHLEVHGLDRTQSRRAAHSAFICSSTTRVISRPASTCSTSSR